MLAEKNHYDTLGLKRTADDAQIKTAYRTLVKEWHPDVCRKPEAETRFKEIQAAYSVLSDRSLRRKYDITLKAKETVPSFDSLMSSLIQVPIEKQKRKTQQRRRRKRGKAEVEDLPYGYGDDTEHLGGII